MYKTTILATAIVLSLTALPLGSGGLPNPILNGDFEVYVDNGEEGYTGGALYWAHSHGSNVEFRDVDGDTKAVVPADMSASNHNFWQSTLPPLQAFSADFGSFEYTVESGDVPTSANNQIGFSLSPASAQHPWVGIFWDGALRFSAAAIADAMGPDGRVVLDPLDGDIICPDYQPCRDFKAAYEATDDAGKSELLGQTRVIQVSFWNFNRATSGEVVIDDVAIEGALPPTSIQVNPSL